MSCLAELGHAAEPTREGAAWAECEPSENKPTRFVQAPPWPPRQKTFSAFPGSYVCEQYLLLCFPFRLLTYPGSTGSTSSKRNIQLGWFCIRSPVSQLADGTKEVFVRAKWNRRNHRYCKDWCRHTFVKSPNLVGNRDKITFCKANGMESIYPKALSLHCWAKTYSHLTVHRQS